MFDDENETYEEKELKRARHVGTALDEKMQDARVHKGTTRLRELVGVCADCAHFAYKKTRLNDELFLCAPEDGARMTRINTTDPLVECSWYCRRQQMSLWRMENIATIIDVPKDKIGFRRKDDKED